MRYQPCPDTWHPFPSLFERFVAGDGSLDLFFTNRPQKGEDWKRRRERVESFDHNRRRKLARALERHNARLGGGGPAVRAARRLGEPGTVAVVTGQQAGVLTGPLYTIYKAVTAIRTARWAEQSLGCPVVPVFWVASDDHDFDEIASVYAMDRRGGIRKLGLEYRPPTPDCVGHIPVPAAAWTLVGEMESILGGGWGIRQLAARALADAERSSSMADWFARILARLLRDRGLVIIDPSWPEVRSLLGPFFHQALLHSRTVTAELDAAAERLQKKGFRPGLDVEPDHSHLFLRREGHRLGLVWRDGCLVDRSGRLAAPIDLKEAVRLASDCPHDLSPNVVLRPVAQEYLLPVLAHVAGPGETSYLAQMREVFPLFGQEMPLIVPRLSVTLVDPDQERTMDEYRLSPGDVPGLIEDRLTGQLRRLDDVGVEEMFSGLKDSITALYAERLPGLESLNPGLSGLGRENLERVLGQVEYLEGKALQHRRRQHRDLVDSFRRLGGLLPQGQSQERMFNIFPYLAAHGQGLIDGLLTLPLDQGHLVAFIDGDPL